MVSARPYGPFFKALANKEIDFDSDALKVMLLTSAYTPDYDAHDYKNDLTNEISGTGYTAGGTTLTTPTLSYIAANSWGVSRANSTAYTAGQVVRPGAGNGFLYQALTSGTSGASVPTYPTTVGGTVTDGGVTWLCVGHGAMRFDADDAAWAASTLTARYAAIYDSSPATDATRPLIGLVDFGADVSSTAGAFTITWDATGILFFIAA